MLFRRSSVRSKAMTSRTTEFRLNDLRSDSDLLTSERIREMTSLALFPSLTMRAMACRALSIRGVSFANQRSAALALTMTAARG